MADFNAGSIEATLRLNRDPFTDGLRLAQKQGADFAKRKFSAEADVDAGKAFLKFDDLEMRADELDGKSVDIDVDVDDTGADVKLDNVKRKVDDLNNKSFHPLLLAILAIGPALIPIAGIAVGALGAAAIGAGSLALAVKGASDAMKEGGVVGQQYSDGVDSLKDSFRLLTQTAANSSLPAFNRALQTTLQAMPGLNGLVQRFSVIGGNVVNSVLHGLITGFIKLEPLFLRLGAGAENIADSFDRWASGSGLDHFQEWAIKNLPAVSEALKNIAEAIVNLVIALGPLGSTSLSTLSILAQLINALPIDVLKVLVPLVIQAYLAFKLWEGIELITARLQKFKVAATEAGAATTTMGSTSRVLGVLGVAYAVDQIYSSATHSKNAVDALKSSFDKFSNGNIKGGIGDYFSSNLSQPGAFINGINALGNKLGVLPDMTSAADKYKQHMKEIADANAKTAQEAADNAAKLTASFADVNKNLQVNDQIAKQWTTDFGYVPSAFADAATNVYKYALVLGTVKSLQLTANTSTQILLDGMDKFSKSAGTAADKADLLGAVLRSSQGDALSYSSSVAGGYKAISDLVSGFADEQIQVAQGNLALKDTMKAAIDAKTGLIDLTANGAVPLITQLQNMQDAAVKAAQGVYQHEVAQKGDSQALQDAQNIFESMTRGTLIDNQGQLTETAKKLGITKDAAKGLADQYFQFDGKTVTTDVQAVGLNNVNDTLNQIGEQLAIISGHPWAVNLTLSAKTLGGISLHDVVNGAATGGLIQRYDAGDMITGPGTGTSDSILARVSNGEFVSTAAATSRWLPFLRLINKTNVSPDNMTYKAGPAMTSGVASSGGDNQAMQALIYRMDMLTNAVKDIPGATGEAVTSGLAPVLNQQTTQAHMLAKQRSLQSGVG